MLSRPSDKPALSVNCQRLTQPDVQSKRVVNYAIVGNTASSHLTEQKCSDFFGGALVVVAFNLPVGADVKPFPADFRTQEIKNDDATLHVRIGGQGPAVVLIHGFGDTGDMWAPIAAELAHDHTVVVPDLRGMGLSSHPDGGYDKKT